MTPNPNNEPSPAVTERPLILVVDDDRGPRESLRFLLKHDCCVLCADSVDQGMQLAREQQIDVVIMDIRMPGKSGIEGLRELRQIDPDIAIIMLTGFASLTTAQEAIRNAASDYMEKPFDTAEMRRVISKHVEQSRLRRKRSKLLSEAQALCQRLDDFEEKNRLAELGQTSAEFVHDLRNVLALMTGSSSMLREEVQCLLKQGEPPSEIAYYLNTLERSMQHCMELLDTWQRLIWQTPAELKRFYVHEFALACADACRASAQSVRARITFESKGEDCELLGDRVQLSRVLNNLIHNALHALPPDCGEVRIRSETRDAVALISVADNGCGIPEDQLSKIFAPCFTTRRKLGGMGLGLFIAQKVAQSHGGHVAVESAVGKGSTFTIHLPVASAATAAAPSPAAAE